MRNVKNFLLGYVPFVPVTIAMIAVLLDAVFGIFGSMPYSVIIVGSLVCAGLTTILVYIWPYEDPALDETFTI
jgi:hypothetical protein